MIFFSLLIKALVNTRDEQTFLPFLPYIFARDFFSKSDMFFSTLGLVSANARGVTRNHRGP